MRDRHDNSVKTKTSHLGYILKSGSVEVRGREVRVRKKNPQCGR